MKKSIYKIGNLKRSIIASVIILSSFSGIAMEENSNREAIEIVENESTLQVESWMNSDKYWNGRADTEEQESAIEIESWMNDKAYWGETTNTERIE